MDNHDPELRKMGEALEMANAKLAELTAERDELKSKLEAVVDWSDKYGHWLEVQTQDALDAILNDAREGGEG